MNPSERGTVSRWEERWCGLQVSSYSLVLYLDSFVNFGSDQTGAEVATWESMKWQTWSTMTISLPFLAKKGLWMATWSCRSALWHRMTKLNAKKCGLIWISRVLVKVTQGARQARHKQTFTLRSSILLQVPNMGEKPCKTLLRRDNFAETSP